MTSATEPGSAEATPANCQRPVRRGPADLPFDFQVAELARTLSSERWEPDWLAAERLAAAAAYEPCRSRRTSSTRRTSTCGRPTSSGSGRTQDRDATTPGAGDRRPPR